MPQPARPIWNMGRQTRLGTPGPSSQSRVQGGSIAVKFVEQFLRIAGSANNSGMWDEEDAYFYDILHLADGRNIPMKVRSLVGLFPVVASLSFTTSGARIVPEFRRIFDHFYARWWAQRLHQHAADPHDYLTEDASWQQPYWNPKSPKNARRILYTS